MNIIREGKTICHFHTSNVLADAWVKKVAERSGQLLDWHNSCGFVGVVYIGDRAKVLAAINELKPELDEAASAENLRICGLAVPPLFRIYEP